MSDATQILQRIHQGDPSAADQLLPLVYEELRKVAAAKLAHEKPGQTLQATALVHEAYLRLVGQTTPLQWDNQRHFFAAAAEAMRRILVENARRKQSQKKGGSVKPYSLLDADVALEPPGEELLALDEVLNQLCNEKPQVGQLVKLRFFAGLTIEEAAAACGISARTAKRHWTYGRAWLRREMERDN